MGKPKRKHETSVAERQLACCTRIVRDLLEAINTQKPVSLNALRSRHSKDLQLPTQPRLVDILRAVPPEHKQTLVPYLRAKPVRTASGIAVVAVMCKPHRCPHIALTGNICVIWSCI